MSDRLLATVTGYRSGWLHLDRRPACDPGDPVLLGYEGRAICGAIVAEVRGAKVRTDFGLFFATPGDDLLAPPAPLPRPRRVLCPFCGNPKRCPVCTRHPGDTDGR